MFSSTSCYEDYTPARITVDEVEGKAHVLLGKTTLIMTRREAGELASRLNQYCFEVDHKALRN